MGSIKHKTDKKNEALEFSIYMGGRLSLLSRKEIHQDAYKEMSISGGDNISELDSKRFQKRLNSWREKIKNKDGSREMTR